MTSWLSKQEVDAFVEANPGLKGVDMIVPDMCGILRGKRIGVEAIDKLYEGGIALPGSTYLLDSTGRNCETIEYGTRDGDPDCNCLGVAGTLKPVPWANAPTGQVIASMVTQDGDPYFADPRYILARAAQPLVDMGYTPVTAIELEFYLLDGKLDAKGCPEMATSPTTGQRQTTTQVYGIDELYEFEDFLTDVEDACVAQDVPADTATAEYGPGQYEINLHHVDDPIKACDDAVLLKRIIKGVARKHGMIATFMAKPFSELAGCGMHIHISLLDKNGNNIFAGPMDPEIGLPASKALRHAIGGLAKTTADGMAVFAPNANSYRRFQANSYAPINTAWGVDNRTVSLRIPRADAKGMRVEHRIAGADANPYLTMATVLAGIHHGLTNKIDPGPIERNNAYDKPVTDLPLRWWQALQTFSESKVLPKYLGAHYCEMFAAARSFENDAFQAQIPPLDYEWYLRTV
ncbi:MAG: glutamine synthetase [Rhodospirillaceae bacterium]|jgi:glutamine synthetase|uniref:glutamine synthetase family protein n=1 Tax=unclassified Hwanghaeella TaxID=2605944 RepID=UPI000C519F4C|nr:glutamine synthetase [Rhodospirillales bacterium]MAX48104.1 glutamine synthetase [Rhodospirillaceae bacterium]